MSAHSIRDPGRAARLLDALRRALLPADLMAAHGRDMHEAFCDLHAEAVASARPLARWNLLERELRSLLATAVRMRHTTRTLSRSPNFPQK